MPRRCDHDRVIGSMPTFTSALRKDELDDAPSTWQADRDTQRFAVPGDIRQEDDQGDEGDRAKAGHVRETYSFVGCSSAACGSPAPTSPAGLRCDFVVDRVCHALLPLWVTDVHVRSSKCVPSCVTWCGMSRARISSWPSGRPSAQMKTRAICVDLSQLNDLPKHGHASGALARRWNGLQRTYSTLFLDFRLLGHALHAQHSAKLLEAGWRVNEHGEDLVAFSLRQVDHSSAFRRSGEELRGGRVESRVDQPLRHLGQENAWDGDAGEVDHQANVERCGRACPA
jgi:hypothetical protein